MIEQGVTAHQADHDDPAEAPNRGGVARWVPARLEGSPDAWATADSSLEQRIGSPVF